MLSGPELFYVLSTYLALAVEVWFAYRRPDSLARWAYVTLPLPEPWLRLPEGDRPAPGGYRENARRALELDDVVGELALGGSALRGVWRGPSGALRNGFASYFTGVLFSVIRIDAAPAEHGRVALEARAWPVGTLALGACLPATLVYAFTVDPFFLAAFPGAVAANAVYWRWRLRRHLSPQVHEALAPLRAALARAREESRPGAEPAGEVASAAP